MTVVVNQPGFIMRSTFAIRQAHWGGACLALRLGRRAISSLLSVLLAMAVGLPLLGRSATPAGVTVEEVDIDGDGRPEIVLANPRLRVVIDRGLPPAGREQGVYDDRFAWGGWVRSIQALPGGQEFLLQSHRVEGCRPAFTGLREEFETPVKLFEGEPAAGETVSFVKLGIGVFQAVATGDGKWEKAELLEALPWEVEIVAVDPGRVVVECSQRLEMHGGVAYQLEKRFILTAAANELSQAISLTNLGVGELETLWYAHPFFAPAAGLGYGAEARAIVPLAIRPGQVDLFPVAPPKPAPLPIWGGLAGRSVALPWMAVGNQAGPWLTLHWHGAAAWLQVWTWQHCFALEPFIPVKLATNETWRQLLRYEVTADSPGLPPPPAVDLIAGSKLLVLTSPMDETGKAQDDLGYLLPTVAAAGGTVVLVDLSQASPTSEQWEVAACAVVVGEVCPSAALLERLRAFVAGGGGLVTNSAALMAAVDWLPATATGAAFRSSLKLWEAPGHRGLVAEHTLHLRPRSEGVAHPILDGLLLWPAVGQDIARAVELRPAESASVIAEFAPGRQVAAVGQWPAVVVGKHGDGKIVCLAMPVAWGISPVWVNWARFGEYHRQFFAQCVDWAAERRPPNPEP